MPNTAVKCGGAPQKIMYVADDAFRRQGVRDRTQIVFASPATAIRKQAPVPVHNVLAAMSGKPCDATYDGYTSCPVVTGYGRMVLTELDYDNKPQERFPSTSQRNVTACGS